MISACEEINRTIGALYTCVEVNEFVRIRTPYLYPDGDVIDLFLKPQEDVATLTDLGESLRWLRMQTATLRRSQKQNRLIEDICLNHGVELYRGMLTLRVQDSVNLAQAVTRLAQAALRTADLWFILRSRSFESVTDEVEEFLKDSKIPYDRGEDLIGRSGRKRSIDFHTRLSRKSSLIKVLSTGNRSSARSLSDRAFASWADLSHYKVGSQALQFISLFDDTQDVWSEEDFALVRDVSTIKFWSRPDEFKKTLIGETA